jgi:chromosome segregation ATPase
LPQGKIVALRTNLNNALTSAFKSESENAIARLRENIAPYTRYVHAEQERILKTQSQLGELHQSISTLRARIEMIGK